MTPLDIINNFVRKVSNLVTNLSLSGDVWESNLLTNKYNRLAKQSSSTTDKLTNC